jgi:hypothetical protein
MTKSSSNEKRFDVPNENVVRAQVDALTQARDNLLLAQMQPHGHRAVSMFMELCMVCLTSAIDILSSKDVNVLRKIKDVRRITEEFAYR